ncbi:mucin-2-like, partial [Sinocyclocheilus rhinocerous]|uniref:mucin-2-like n=1 Tax=Sinocyclocheilus rhinocerous TaxID=307959 RepID=UPI0007BA7255
IRPTTEYTTKPTTEKTKESTTTIKDTTTTQLTTAVSTTEYKTTTQPPTSQSTKEYTTQLSTTERTTEYTTTTRPPTTESTRETYTTPMEETTTTHPPPTERTTEHRTTTHPSTTESTTESYTTPVEETTTTQPPPNESTTEHRITTYPPTTESTTDSYTTPVEETTTTQPPPTESTTEHRITTHPPTTESTTDSYTTPVEETTTTQPPPTESTTEHRTTTRPSTTESTTESYKTPVEETTTQPPILQSTTEYTTQQSTTKRTTESDTTPLEETTKTQSPTSESTTEYTTQVPTTESTTEYKTTAQPPTSESTTQPTISTKQYTTTTQATTETTTSVKYSTSVSTVSTTELIIVTGPVTTNLTPRSPQKLYTTINPTITTPSLTSVLSTTIPTTEHTTPVCECKDVMRNQSWSCGETWRENCADKVCKAGVIEVKSITCPTPTIRTYCPGNKMSLVKDKETCCESWECDCQCQVYGDPHYISFQGIAFDFMDNCTYTLVEEQVLQHRLSITVDNYYCVPEIDNSCSRGITLKYWNDIATLMVTEEFTVESTLNQEIIRPPYEDQVFKFESSGSQVYMYIKPIRSYVSLTPFNNLLINLAMEHFQNNTQGQCGVCGGQSCIRRNGVVEDDNCCDKTAYDWVVEDPLKPYCKSALTSVPCVPTSAPPPPPSCITSVPCVPTSAPPPPPSCNPTICDLLHHEVFLKCGETINIMAVEKNCRFDYCSYNSRVGACSSLEYAASECKRIGICVDWRYLTNGSCEITCPEGMMYNECQESPNDVCQGGVRVPATSVVGLRSGCFCPDDQMLAEEHKKICVSECTTCKGPLGEPMPVGAVWESNCHICTCNNQTRTEECIPKPRDPTPVCSVYSSLVSDCCDNQICTEKICEYNGITYKVGDQWTDPSRPCESFSCSQTGTEVEKTVCPVQTCAEVRMTKLTPDRLMPQMPLRDCKRVADDKSRLLGRTEGKIGKAAELLEFSRSHAPLLHQHPLAGPPVMPAISKWYAGNQRPGFQIRFESNRTGDRGSGSSARSNRKPHDCRQSSASAAEPGGADAWLPSSAKRGKRKRSSFIVKESRESRELTMHAALPDTSHIAHGDGVMGNITCTARLIRMNLTIADCTQEVELPICEGQCETHNRWVHTNDTLQLEQSHQCCKERSYEMREITLTCSKNSPTHFTYRHVTGCECKVEG